MVAKLAPDLKRLLWSTYIGASGEDWERGGLTLDTEDNVYLVGHTDSFDFPARLGNYQAGAESEEDAVIIKLSADGSRLIFATRFGGSGNDEIVGVRVDKAWNIHVGGITLSRDFPVTEHALQKSYGGGQKDGVLAVLSADGSRLLYATYLGGTGEEIIRGLAFGKGGEVYLIGSTDSVNFPITPGAVQPRSGGNFDAFFVRLDPIPGNATH